MDKNDHGTCEFCNLMVNEVEIETFDDKAKINASKKAETPFFDVFDYTNGAIHEQLGYCWSQNFTEIGMQFGMKNRIVLLNLTTLFCRSSRSITRKYHFQKSQSKYHQHFNRCVRCRERGTQIDSQWTIKRQM